MILGQARAEEKHQEANRGKKIWSIDGRLGNDRWSKCSCIFDGRSNDWRYFRTNPQNFLSIYIRFPHESKSWKFDYSNFNVGHQWLLKTFGVKPKSSWSVDPFGHGGTFPYVLKASGVDKGMVIMRIHYAWKEYFALEQSGDFMWQQRWDQSPGGRKDESQKSGKHSILCHNFPYDIYSVKGSCGPSADVCVQFNFGVLGKFEFLLKL